MDFQKIKEIRIAKPLLEEAYNFLKKAGKNHFEALALFAGQQSNGIFKVCRTILPLQTSYKLEGGLMYAVDGEELLRINTWLYQHNMQLIAQVHSHPQEAFHSETDDRFPIVDTFGGVSMVVPEFATGPLNFENWEIYRLFPHKGWTNLDPKEIQRLIRIN